MSWIRLINKTWSDRLPLWDYCTLANLISYMRFLVNLQFGCSAQEYINTFSALGSGRNCIPSQDTYKSCTPFKDIWPIRQILINIIYSLS